MIKHFYHSFKCLFYRCLLVVGLGFFTLFFAIGNASAENLKQIIIAANLQNPNLLSARLRLLSEAEIIEQAYGAVRPQLHIALNGALHSLTEENKTQANRYSSDAYGDITAALVLNQHIYAGGALWASINIAEASLGAVLQDVRATEQDIFSQAFRAYADYITARATKDLRDENVARLGRHLQATMRSFELGRANRTDIALAQSRHASAIADRDEAQAIYDETTLEYTRIVGEPPQENKLLPVLPDETLDALNNSSLDTMIKHALQDHPLMKASELRLDVAKNTVRLRNAEHYPQLSASASLQHNDSDAPMRPDSEQSFVLRGQVIVPIYSGGTTSSKVREARYNYRRQQQSHTATHRQIIKIVGSAKASYLAAITGLDARKAAVDSADLALQGITREYDLGSRSFLDLLDSEQNYTEAAIARTRAESNLFVSIINVLAARGKLTTTDLGLQDPMAEIAVAIATNKNLRKSIRKTDKGGTLELQLWDDNQ